MRVYGPRWNEKTCFIGRRATLSKGYEKGSRLRRLKPTDKEKQQLIENVLGTFKSARGATRSTQAEKLIELISRTIT